MRTVRILLVALAALSLVGPLAAQTSSSPDDVYEGAMSHWRAATWYSRLGDPNITAIEIDTLRTSWQEVAAFPDNARPSPYRKDAEWPQTVVEISKLIGTASDAADQGDSAAANAALERIGDALAEARRRAGGTGSFADAVRTYRATVDRLSGLVTFAEQRQGAAFDDARRAEVQQAANACTAAAAALKPAIPPRRRDEPKLAALIQQNVDSVQALQTALARHASGLPIAAAINVIRSNYSLLFLNYG